MNTIDNTLMLQKIHADIVSLSEQKVENKGGGGDNGSMEDRVGKLEGLYEGIQSRLSLVEKDLRSGFKITWGLIVGLGLLIAHGFHWF